jgi:hypothetical protein
MKRKYLLFLLLATIGSNLLQAQIKKGTVLLGGGISFGNGLDQFDNNTYELKTTGISIWPSVGKAIKDNLVFGFFGQYGHNRQEYEKQPFSDELNNFSTGVFLRRYLPVFKQLYLFGQCHLQGGYTISRNYWNTGFRKTQSYGIHVGVYPGLSFALNRKIHFESGFNGLFSTGFGHQREENIESSVKLITRSNGFNMSANLNSISAFTLGMRFLLAQD